MRKVTFNNRYYIVKTATREAQYLAIGLANLRIEYKVKIAHLQRQLKDLDAITKYIKEQRYDRTIHNANENDEGQ